MREKSKARPSEALGLERLGYGVARFTRGSAFARSPASAGGVVGDLFLGQRGRAGMASRA